MFLLFSVATSACKSLNNSPRSLTLLATVLTKDPLQLSTTKAKPLVEKALAADPNHLPAVYLLAKILEQESNIEAAIELLKKQLGKAHFGMALQSPLSFRKILL